MTSEVEERPRLLTGSTGVNGLKYPDLSLEWKEIYSLPFTVTQDTKIREFQYKLLNNGGAC